MTDEQDKLNYRGAIWFAARRIIAEALAERDGEPISQNHLDFAATVIARLTYNEPPLLICSEDEMKEE